MQCVSHDKAGAHGTAGMVLAVPLFEQCGGCSTLSELCDASNGHERSCYCHTDENTVSPRSSSSYVAILNGRGGCA